MAILKTKISQAWWLMLLNPALRSQASRTLSSRPVWSSSGFQDRQGHTRNPVKKENKAKQSKFYINTPHRTRYIHEQLGKYGCWVLILENTCLVTHGITCLLPNTWEA